MVDNLLFHDLLLVVLLWLGIRLSAGWSRHRSVTGPTARKPAPALQPRSRELKPFPGLTRKPYCAACEQAQEPSSPVPLALSSLLSLAQGRPRQVDTSKQFCPQPHCAYYGWV